ncbi:TIM-barrel domain-containing protein [Aquimarina brevivitae]|uniref:Oligosaccharide 4-alpha-D-glucosyltransferase n=1 Tax=Aquimarina brevivitae TaxID=323412 RepID=A0A4Q7P2M9_9FLAO|nr:TIM-barrel domain-containing protein [Aquimarina brevivitae]RZS93630.1 oligosaccharide 4-alpha-D-glucosyltransferase [Aquimarina brevivitae]
MYTHKILYLSFLFTLFLVSCGKQDGFIIEKEGFIEIPRDNGTYVIKTYSDNIIETSFVPEGETFIDTSHAVVMTPKQKAFLQTRKNGYSYGTKGIKAIITKEPFGIRYEYKGKPLLKEQGGYIKTDSTEGLQFALAKDEVIYGAGNRVVGMNRRGYKYELYNKAHYGYETESKLMNFNLPLVLSSKLYAVHFDNPSVGYLDIDSQNDNTLTYETLGGRKTYQVIATDNWKGLVNAYTSLTGKQPMPPRWALGNFASRFGYHSQEEVYQVVDKFKKDSIPLDAIILDIYWFGKDIKGHMGNFEFVKDSFPNPKKMIKDLRDDHIKTILITEPFVLTTSKKWQEALAKDVLAKNKEGNAYTYDFYFGNTGLIDIYSEKGNQWFWDIYKRYTQDYGVAGWWGDLGEPEVHPSDIIHATGTASEVHNIYGHDWAKLVYEGYQKDFPNTRPFILMRAGYSGSQRYGMIPWSGDVNRSWGGLQPQPQIALSMGVQGLGYMHSDLGGFAGGETFDSELYTRWLQYGVFQPIFRPHAQEHIAPEPVFHDPKTKANAKKSIELRYRLLPYNYTLAFQNSQSGMPLMRPLFFEEPNNTDFLELSYAYLWGEDLLVAPVLKPGVVAMDVPFPETSNWYDFYTDERFTGGQFARVEVTDDRIPVYVRGGAFIPMIDPIMNTTEYNSKALIIHYYPDDTVVNSVGQLYHDDGKTPEGFKKGAYELLNFVGENLNNELSLVLSSEVGSAYKSQDRSVKLIIHNIRNVPLKLLINNKTSSYSYDAEKNVLIIPVDWKSGTAKQIKIVQPQH